MREILHFAHGNGFPSPCYRQLLDGLQTRYDCYYIDRIGHSSMFPVTENWHLLVDELIHSIRQQACKPVIAVGHSLGGVLSFRAAVEEPELFKAIVLLDSPIIGRLKSNLLRISKSMGLIDHITPALRTRGRKRHWKNREELFEYLKSRKLFKDFTTECLNDYIDYGMDEDENGLTLRFDPQVEYNIYRTIPHMLYKYEGKLKRPCALIYGDKSDVIERTDVKNMVKNHQITPYKIAGTHMFPMEKPKKTASLIFKAVEDFNL